MFKTLPCDKNQVICRVKKSLKQRGTESYGQSSRGSLSEMLADFVVEFHHILLSRSIGQAAHFELWFQFLRQWH